MIRETTYTPEDLESGECTSCGEESNEIVIGEGKCCECIEAINFENMTMIFK